MTEAARVIVLDDSSVAVIAPAEVVDAAREALRQFAEGGLHAPPRVRAGLAAVDYVFTVGALNDATSGFRAYRAGSPAGDQLTAVWTPHGRLAGIVVGDELGVRRTGAFGAVAADLLARQDAAVAGLVGSGRQAWSQLEALAAVRVLRQVRVYSTSREHREAFARRCQQQLDVEAVALASPEAAVDGADVVVLATRSTNPAVDAEAISDGTHVTTVGPKSVGGHELPVELAARASVVTCDSPAQAAAYPEPFFLPLERLTSLGDVLLDRSPGRVNDTDVTLHCSVGLAGSEVLLAARLLLR